ncbi:alpha/beta-hydrolase [Lentithecium fluviatile CBS 122367]|uniref:Acyl-protein thioesterase 1 n=1 Tax=Lentithecium fluviatile CBS 122367 TaxID=1168545 RepID=A0A6G1J614_9PLEO|nr:alpha/beta-hydrolase [Lentithecium fluviatile CBS 122367]
MSAERKPPIIIPPSSSPSDPSKSAAFIFIHGLGDDAAGVEPIARQFQAARKLPHMSWILPNALDNREVASTAWYISTKPSPFPPSRPELEDDEDEVGLKASREYIDSLIDDLIAQDVLERRIVLGGFSQGHAMALLVGLTSQKYAGKLGGLVGLSGYLPLPDNILALRKEAGLPEKIDDDMDVFIGRGTRGMPVPKRYLAICSKKCLECGIKEEKLTVKEYDGMGHDMGGAELRDLCAWVVGCTLSMIRKPDRWDKFKSIRCGGVDAHFGGTEHGHHLGARERLDLPKHTVNHDSAF